MGIDLFTTTGARMNEALQISLDKECLIILTLPPTPGAKDQTPRRRFVLRLIPKGERTDTRHDYFVSQETVGLIERVARMLQEHYGIDLEKGEKLPFVDFNHMNSRHYRFGEARYLFQYNNTHLHSQTLTASMRFLLHGMIFQKRDGTLVIIKAHLLRHLFATHAHQVEGVPLDIVGAWLKQKNLAITDYYARVTESMVAEAADSLLARIAQHIDARDPVLRLPEEIQKQAEEAQARVGTLANVTGGECTNHNLCPPQFMCVGCHFKVPDPSKRYQVEQIMGWAADKLDYYTREGLLVESEQVKHVIRNCKAELREMDMIENYRRDEGNPVIVQISKRKRDTNE
jgi:hypothetical protein